MLATTDAPRPTSGRAQATRAALVEAAAKLFTEQGYVQTSMRDIVRAGPVSLASIYAHFKNKADLFVGAIERQITVDLEGPQVEAVDPRAGHVERLTEVARRFPERRVLRNLLVQGAAASVTDTETRTAVQGALRAHVDQHVAAYVEHRDESAIDPDLDLEVAVLYSWAVELGLGVLELLDMAPRSTEGWADLQHRMARSWELRPADTTG